MLKFLAMAQADYLVIGHICADVVPGGLQVGGAVAYAGRTAQVLGCQTAVLSSASPHYDWHTALPGLCVSAVPSPHTTTFENIYTPAGRRQVLHARATPLQPFHLPVHWQSTPIVHLAPVADEVSIDLAAMFPNSLVGITPQGWLRTWNEAGQVSAREWPDAETVLRQVTAVILSQEDLPNMEALHQYRQWANLLVMTQGKQGCSVFQGETVQQFPAPAVQEVEPTGAGDIFAAAFLVRLHESGRNVAESAVFANHIAAQSVTQAGLPAKIATIQQFTFSKYTVEEISKSLTFRKS